ncbi:prostatic acid phosphatase-like [Diorhabda sublineata]|uniref:prostatic acid phosphatase-like n=1 Tax=Diorhabda sublineata TaxID=1163346 RepID=UPI0024E0F991|nr:prostatic acid phosphatase-like [Diorhabda sublineata]
MALSNKFIVVLVLLKLCFCGTTYSTSANKNLVAVVQIFRHGQRTPVQFYTNDPYSNITFWDGLEPGQLTNVGKRQQYQLGQFSRHRYKDWLSLIYDKNVFYAQTTDVDRTHMSAQANIYGLYPAEGDEVWKPRLDWQPIPIHPADANVISSFPDCPNFIKEWANVLSSTYFLSLDKLYAPIYKYLTEKSGDNITSLSEASDIYDCLKIESDVGLKIPDWSNIVFPQYLKNISGYSFKSLSYTTKLQRLGGGPLLNEILKHFESFQVKATNPKYKIYSAHDSNIAMILNSLGAFDPPYPPDFASSIYFELRKKNGKFYVNVFSKNNNDFKPVSIRGCDLDCPLSEVRARLSDILIDVKLRNAECTENLYFSDKIAEERYNKLITSGELNKTIIRF